MSCQQVPRLTEDPYVFTETVSTTPVLFNPQKSRQQQQQFKQITQSHPQSQPNQANKQDTSNVNVSQTYFSGRFNGTTTAIETPSASITQQQQIINGMQKNVISITTINNGNNSPTVPIKLPQQIQHSHSKIVTTTPTVVTSCCTLPTQVISWNQTQSSVSPPAQHFQQQQTQTAITQQPSQQHQQQQHQQQQHQQQQHQQQQHNQQHQQEQQSFYTLTTNCNSNAQNLQCPSPLLPPSNFHQNTLAQHIQKVGSSSTNSTSRPQSLLQQQYSKITTHPQIITTTTTAPTTVSHSREGVTTPSSSSPSSHSSDSSNATVKLNHSDLNEIPVSVIYRNTPVKSEPGESPRPSGGESSVDLNSTPLNDHKPLTVRKSIDFCDKGVVFATPAKRDSRVLSSSAKKSLKCTSIGGAPGKAKRTHSQTTHHEALQRISSSPLTHHSSSLSLTGSSLSPPIRRKLKVRKNSVEWHAPDTYIFDSVSPLTSLIERRQRSAEKCDSMIASARASCVQQHWLGVYDLDDPVKISPRTLNAGREERIERHKALLRRQAVQLISSQEFLRPTVARSRLVFVSKFLQKFKTHEDRSAQTEKCCVPSCTNYALALTTQCYIHITRDLDQHLFLPCTAKFADNTQCRIPVFDISHELPLCREHGWKRDNYNRIVQEQKPKAKLTRKRTKSNTLCGRPPKRSKKKRKGSTSSLESIGSSSTTLASTPTGPVAAALGPPALSTNCMVPSIVVDDGVFPCGMIDGEYTGNDFAQVVSQTSAPTMHMDSTEEMDVLASMRHQIQQDVQHMLNMCENSSVYPSSEDTGVGGLSESELMVGTQDAEEIPLSDTRLLEEHDLTNVLNNLPVVAFNELFTVVHQDEREEVERALELADKQIKSLQQMTGNDADFLRDLLDGSDQILDDTDICTEIVSSHSPDTSGIDTNTLFVDGGSNSTAGSCTGHTPTDIRGLVQT